MEKIRDLIIRKVGEKDECGAYYLDSNGDLWFEDSDGLRKEYPCTKKGCSDCKFCISNPKTSNSIYQCKPLPSLTCRCKIIDELYEDFDITIKSDYTLSHAVCKYFEPKFNHQKWNVNQFIDIKNCCNIGDGFIQGISYKGKQAPFTLYISQEEWFDLNFILDNKIRVIDPVNWWNFSFDGNEISNPINYCILNKIDANIQKEVKDFFYSNWIEARIKYSGKIFNFNTMWFE